MEKNKPKSYEDIKKKLNSYGKKKLDPSMKEKYQSQTDNNFKDC